MEDQKPNKWDRVAGWLKGRRTTLAEEPTEMERLHQEIEAARSEWAIAQKHIDYVSDPDLIDHAIYYLEAAERKYGFLLREAKRRYSLADEKAKQPLL